MSKELTELLNQLEEVLQDTQNWQPLDALKEELLSQTADMRERLQRIHEPLIVAITGGTGVGKSTLFNALVGEEIAEVSPIRPHTGQPTVLHPEGLELKISGLSEANYVARPHFKNIVLIDTPDWDSAKAEHWTAAQEVLGQCDLILLCAESEKYKIQKTWDILTPLKQQRGLVCVQTRVDRHDPAIWEDWKAFMLRQGFSIHSYFEVNALNAWHRIMELPGKEEESEFQFEELKAFLYDSLSVKHNEAIKTSNVEEMLLHSVDRLHESLAARDSLLKRKESQLHELKDTFKTDLMQVLAREYLSSPESLEKTLAQQTAASIEGLSAFVFKSCLALKSAFAYFQMYNLDRPIKGLLSKATESSRDEKKNAFAPKKLPAGMRQFLEHYQTQLSNVLEEAEFSQREVEELTVLDEATLKDLHTAALQLEDEKLKHYGKILSSIWYRILLDFLPCTMIVLLLAFFVKYALRWELLPVSAFLYFIVFFLLFLWLGSFILNKRIGSFSRKISKLVAAEMTQLVGGQEAFFSHHQLLLAAARKTLERVEGLQKKAQEVMGKVGES